MKIFLGQFFSQDFKIFFDRSQDGFFWDLFFSRLFFAALAWCVRASVSRALVVLPFLLPLSFPSFPSSFLLGALPQSRPGYFLGYPPYPPTPPHCVGCATLEFNGPLPQGGMARAGTSRGQHDPKGEGERERGRVVV